MTLTIISGASRGIGKAIAEDLRNLGHKFILLSSYVVDFNNPEAVYYLFEEKLRDIKVDRINIILCAAQIGEHNSINVTEIERLFRINVLSNFSVIQSAFSSQYKSIRIVWFAGGGAAFPYPEFFGYSLSKVAVVRAVENIAVSGMLGKDSSIIALAPGAVSTDMLQTVLDAGCEVRTKTDISEPVNFVRKFITDEFDCTSLNGKFLHVRDTLNIKHKDIFTLRRVE